MHIIVVHCASTIAERRRGTTILMPTAMVDSMNPAIALSLTGSAKIEIC
ncbi:hypothetical protein [Methylobacterium soli]|nr:hypothetical protein [Methylobacterium soli]